MFVYKKGDAQKLDMLQAYSSIEGIYHNVMKR